MFSFLVLLGHFLVVLLVSLGAVLLWLVVFELHPILYLFRLHLVQLLRLDDVG